MALIKPEQLRSGSYNITGSLFGTSSYANYALTASFALNGGGGGSTFPFTGSAIITGSLGVTGSFNQGLLSSATGLFAHAQGYTVIASGQYSHAEGTSTIASGDYSHAEGSNTLALGAYSHAEGENTTAAGSNSHAEGYFGSASGDYSHAEGSNTTATGPYSHAEGYGGNASGYASHAEGLFTVASGSYQHVQGQYNISSSAQSAFIVGNGTGVGALRSNLIFASGSQVQVTGSVIATTGFTGSLQGTATTASYVLNAISASYAPSSGGTAFPFTGSAIISGSLVVTGSVRATAGFTGSLQGTASLATFAAAANLAFYADTANSAALAAAPSSDWIPAKPDPVTRLSPYSLGSPDAWWNSLYVGNSTIYFLSESIGGPTISSSLSVIDDPDGSSRFVLGTKESGSTTKNIVISDKGISAAISASYALTASYVQNAQTASFFSGSVSNAVSASYALTASFVQNAQTASFINPTFISQSAAASGFGAGVTYVSASNNPLNEIEVADYDSNVAVTFVNGRLKFIFGTPTAPSAPVASFNSTFATDRFNKVTDAYTVTGTIAVGGYTLISASLYEGGVLLTSTGSLATQLTYSTTTTGSHTYVLHVTASSPLDNSLNIQSASLSGTLSKTNPGSPTITPTATVQLGSTSNQIEQGATGSISFVSASGTANSWVHNFTSTNVTSPIFVTGSATGSSSITATATSNYSSSGVLGADNIPALITQSINSFTYTKIRSLRYGASTATSFTSTELENLALWDTTLGGTVGTVSKGTTTASGQTLTITWTGDKYHYIAFNSSLASLTNITTGGFGVFSSFTLTTVGQYKVYRINTLQAGGAGTSITYVLT